MAVLTNMSMLRNGRVRFILSSNPLAREFVLGLFLLAGTHVFVVDIRTFASVGAIPSLTIGIATGIVLQYVLHRSARSIRVTASVVLAAVVGLGVSWLLAATLVGSDAESVRIPAFGLAVLGGSIVFRLAGDTVRT